MPIKNKNAQLNDELSFLIACCQIDPSEDDIEFIHSILNDARSGNALGVQQLDTKALLGLATQHGILPLVYKTLKQLHIDVQEHFLKDLKSSYTQIAQRNMLMSAELIRIMKLLEENDIEALAFKGPVLSQIAYGDITLRQYGDLDILVDEKIAYKAGELLQGHGFTASYPLSILNNKTCMRVDNDFALVGNTNNILIEMHWRLFRKNIGHHLTFDQFSKDSKTISINGNAIQTLSPELHLLYLSLHGSKHAWERIEWIVDIDKFIRNNILDEQLLKETFKILKADRPILVGLLLAHRFFQTPLQTWIIKKINKDHEIEALYVTTVELLNQGFHTMTEIQRTRTIYLYQRRFFKSSAEKIKYFLETYLSISSNDCKEFPLPPSLRFLYLFIKPVRILFKYLRYKK